MYSALGFDLDNTLFDQSQHLRSFFRQAGAWVSEQADVAGETVEKSFIRTWERRTMACPFVFDEALQELGLWRPEWVRELVAKYRSHRCPLAPYYGVRGLLARLARTLPLFLITDGHSELQRFKVDNLKLRPFFRATIFTADYGPGWEKPAPYAFHRAALLVGVRTAQCLFVGDDPERDIKGAKGVGMATARVLTGPYRDRACQPPPDLVVPQAVELEAILCGPKVAVVGA